MVDSTHPLASYALQGSLLLPFLGTAAIFFGGGFRTSPREISQRWPGLLACALVAVSLALSVLASFATRNHGTISVQAGEWIPGFGPAFSLQLDWLSSWLLLLVEIIGLMVGIFSTGYLRHEADQRRYFGELLFFIGMMKLLVLAGSYLLLFAGWEGVGLASYLLIGYHFERPFAAGAATKAFLVNRIGDAGFMVAIIALALTCKSTNYNAVEQAAVHVPHPTMTLICSLLVVGAIGKSAQFPLHVWLPDAMEGPTPVSALIHSATMVCAGVYLLARSTFLFSLVPEVAIGVAILGAITALFAATVALVEEDIKRVLAYSTISQIGFMFLALGLGANRAAMFHVVTHAFFKSLLFLGAGSIIHSLHGEQNLKRMGGLRKRLPVTFWTMCIAGLTLAGVPGLSAFFSKDLIIEAGFLSGHIILTLTGLATSLLTAIYSWRLISLTFFGVGHNHLLEVHEGPVSMRIPLIVLAAACFLVGWIFVPIRWTAWLTMTTSSVLAFGGILIAWQFYVNRPEARTALDRRFATVAKFLRNRWYIDAIFEAQIVRGLVLRTAAGAAAADALLIDRAVNGIAWSSRQAGAGMGWSDSALIDGIVRFVSATVRFLSWPSRALQSGFVQTYALLFLAGVLAALGFCLAR
jgi:NADH-quinone oxidoreductase subunit L